MGDSGVTLQSDTGVLSGLVPPHPSFRPLLHDFVHYGQYRFVAQEIDVGITRPFPADPSGIPQSLASTLHAARRGAVAKHGDDGFVRQFPVAGMLVDRVHDDEGNALIEMRESCAHDASHPSKFDRSETAVARSLEIV
jgi:hypothetical protein